MQLDRRRFLTLAGAGALSACSANEEPAADAPPAAATFSRPLGAQLYTLRSVLPDDPAQILKDLAAIGYAEAEVLQAGWDELAPLVADAGLAPVSMHVRPGVVTGDFGSEPKMDRDTPGAAAEWAAGFGVKWLVMPYLPNDQRGETVDDYKALAAKLNTAAEAAKAAGLGFAYHNHAFEFGPLEDTTPLDVLMAETDPELVKLELDVFWTKLAGRDPAQLIRDYGGRAALLHLKDLAPGVETQFQEGAPPEWFKEVGNGVIDFAAVLAAAEENDAAHYFVEQDQTPGHPLDSLRQSYAHLRAIEV